MLSRRRARGKCQLGGPLCKYDVAERSLNSRYMGVGSTQLVFQARR